MGPSGQSVPEPGGIPVAPPKAQAPSLSQAGSRQKCSGSKSRQAKSLCLGPQDCLAGMWGKSAAQGSQATPPGNDPWSQGGHWCDCAKQWTKEGWSFRPRCLPLPHLLAGQPADGLGYKAGPARARMRSQGLRTGVGMKSVLLGWVLALLWVSAAQAEVLVQPDFDAKKVQEPQCALRVGLGAEPRWKQQRGADSNRCLWRPDLRPANPVTRSHVTPKPPCVGVISDPFHSGFRGSQAMWPAPGECRTRLSSVPGSDPRGGHSGDPAVQRQAGPARFWVVRLMGLRSPSCLAVLRPLVRGLHGFRLQGLPGQEGPPADVHQSCHSQSRGQPPCPHGVPWVSLVGSGCPWLAG